MRPIRRLAAIAAAAAVVMLPLTFSGAQPAVAYCENSPTSDGGNGCSNSCEKTNEPINRVSNRLGLGDLVLCPQ